MSYPHFRSESELALGVKLWQVVPLVLIVLGTIGNILSIIIMSQKRFRTTSAVYYLIALAISDLFVLYAGLLTDWAKHTWDFDFELMSDVTCKAYWWLGYFSSELPVWILVTITIERLIATLVPYKSKRICTPRVAKIVMLVLPISILVINLHLAIGFGRQEIIDSNNTTVFKCVPLTQEYDNFFNNAWVWIDLCKFSLGPFAIIAIGNGCIVWKLFVSERKSRARIGPTQSTATAQKPNDNNRNTTILLVCLNVVFIVCTSPICIYFIGQPYWVPEDVPKYVQLQDPWWALVNLLVYLNSTINFLLYILSGSKFRNELKRMFTRNQVQPITG